MYVAQWTSEQQGWEAGSLQPYGPIQMYPSAQVLNYGQSVFEGMKAQRTAKGNIVLFRCGNSFIAQVGTGHSMPVATILFAVW